MRALLPLACLALAWQARAFAQLPDAPSPQPAHSQQEQRDPSQDGEKQQTKRILGIIPNFRAVYSTSKLPPQTAKEKFMTATQDSFDYSSVFVPGVLAGYSLATNATPEFGHGALGYGRYFWHAAVDQTSENYWVEFIVPVLAHQDTRYYTLGHGGFLKRTGYALTRAVVTRSDNSKEEFNTSEVLGAGIASALSAAYYPASHRNVSNIGMEWATDVGFDGMSFFLKEFWPDINQHVLHRKHPQS